MSIKAVWWSFFHSFFSARPFDRNIWSSFVYCFFWAQPFDKNMWSSFIYSFFCPRPFDQTLGSTLIYFFYLYTTIWPKIRVFIDIFLSFVDGRSTKNRVLINLLLYLHTTFDKVRGHSYYFIYSFLRCVNILFAIFMADTALIFPSLCFWQYCLYNSSTIFIVVLPISLVHYIHWRAVLIFCTLYPWLYESLAKTSYSHGYSVRNTRAALLWVNMAILRNRIFSQL